MRSNSSAPSKLLITLPMLHSPCSVYYTHRAQHIGSPCSAIYYKVAVTAALSHRVSQSDQKGEEPTIQLDEGSCALPHNTPCAAVTRIFAHFCSLDFVSSGGTLALTTSGRAGLLFMGGISFCPHHMSAPSASHTHLKEKRS